ncbi:geranylgeranyl reductase family protein [bacterium]|nr:geranylgeranyl reductase family protein [bacterium]
MKKNATIIIIGAGPAGTSAAYHLTQAGIDVLLLDKESFPRDKICGDCLSPSSMQELEKIGLRDEVTAKSNEIDGCILYAPNKSYFTVDNCKARPHLMMRETLDNMLLKKACEKGADFLENTRIICLEKKPDRIILKDDSGESYSCKLAIIATGSNSSLPIRLGLLKLPSADAIACRAYVADINFSSDKILLSYAKDLLPGYGWVFPLGKGKANVGIGYFFSKGNNPNPRKIWKTFAKFLEKEGIFGKNTKPVSEVKTALMRMGLRGNRLFAERILLAGDSASAINPLSGEGIYYALQTGRFAAWAAQQAIEAGDFTAQQLLAYQKMLKENYKKKFKNYRKINRLLSNQAIINQMVKIAGEKRELAETIFVTLLGESNPMKSLKLFAKHIIKSWFGIFKIVRKKVSSRDGGINKKKVG